MTTPEDMASLSREELLALVAELQRQVAVLQKQMTELSTRNQALAAENDQLKRSAKRQATPFSKGTRTREPRCPGRQPGEGPFSFRQAPRPEEITEPPVNVPMTLECCPRCGGKLAEERVDLAYITELPPMPRPQVTQYRVWVYRCTGCGRKVCGEHPDLASDQHGATTHRLGPRARAGGLGQLVYVLQGDVPPVVQEGLAQSQHQVTAGTMAFSPLQTPHMSWVNVGLHCQSVAG